MNARIAASPTFPPMPRAFAGLRQVVRLNWTSYAAAVVTAGGALALRGGAHLAAPFALLLLLVATVTLGWLVASLLATAWVYDLSPLRHRSWIPALLPRVPRRWLNLHSGLDESSDALRRLFPHSEGSVADLYDPSDRNAPSIRRARSHAGLSVAAIPPRTPSRLAAADGSLEAVFLIFAAHEVRRRTRRELLFGEIRRVLSTDGVALVVEHARDCSNFVAFGPGAFHFQPVSEWRRLARMAGLEIDLERRMTPFVRILRLRRP